MPPLGFNFKILLVQSLLQTDILGAKTRGQMTERIGHIDINFPNLSSQNRERSLTHNRFPLHQTAHCFLSLNTINFFPFSPGWK